MAVQKILLAGDPILRRKSKPIESPQEEGSLIEDLKDTLQDFIGSHDLGRGIAASQIGISKRALYIIEKDFTGELINPKIINHSDETNLWWDSCFSYQAAIFAKVRRWSEVDVEYFDLQGNRRLLQAKGSLSELLQHEIDHLDGTLFMDRKEETGEWLMMREEWENLGRPGLV